jgi:hypothetical protein
MLGYCLLLKQITPAIVQEVASDFHLDQFADSSGNADGQAGLTTALRFLHQKQREDLSRSAKPIEKTAFQPWVKSE